MKNKILKFNKEKDGHWYIDLPNWPFAHHNLMMVAGADDLCEHLSDNGKNVAIKVITNSKPEIKENWGKLSKIESSLFGATYKVENIKNFNKNIWLCPVTLFVFKKYPKNIYIKVLNDKECFKEYDKYLERLTGINLQEL